MTRRLPVTTSVLILAVALLLPAVAGGTPQPSYEAGIRQVQQAIAKGELGLAETTLQRLGRRYGKNPELLAMTGRVLFWQKRYPEALTNLRAALKLKPDPELKRELERVQTAQDLDQAERLMASKDDAAAAVILTRLFWEGRDRYRSGLALAKLRLRNGDPDAAAQLLAAMIREFPRERDLALLNAQALLAAQRPGEALLYLQHDPEAGRDLQLLALRGRALVALRRFPEAAAAFTSSLSLADDSEVRSERERAYTADLLQRSDTLVARGETAQAMAVLTQAFQAGRDRYGTGIRLAALHTGAGEHGEASRIYLLLMQGYPDDAELPLLYARSLANAGDKEGALGVLAGLKQRGEDPRVAALRGRILFWQGRYQEARSEYDRAVRLGAAAQELAAEREEVEEAIRFAHLKELVAGGAYQAAEPLLAVMSAGGRYVREGGLLKLKVLLARNEAEEAAAWGETLYRRYPGDSEVAASYAEALLRAQDGAGAQRVLDRIEPAAGNTLEQEREELFLRARGNWLKAYGSGYGYSGGYGSEESAGIAFSQRWRRVTAVGAVGETTRFRVTDPQLALDLYLAGPRGQNLYGRLSLSASPGARFLPRSGVGVEVSKLFSPLELSVGYTRLDFRDSAANIVTPALIWYLPAAPLSLGERLYLVPENGTVMSVTTLRWDPAPRWGGFVSLGGGNSGERLSRQEDLRRYATYSLRAGAEYRLAASYSIGGEGSFETRRGLYDRYGASLFVKYWWP